MNLITKAKLAGLVLAIALIFSGTAQEKYSVFLFLIVMLSIGIPHGSVDHLIAFVNPKARKFKNKFTFYLVYLSLILFNVLLWYFEPLLGLGVFLLVSCYHFGEAQIIGYNSTKNKFLNFVIGANILLALFLNNINDILEIFAKSCNHSDSVDLINEVLSGDYDQATARIPDILYRKSYYFFEFIENISQSLLPTLELHFR